MKVASDRFEFVTKTVAGVANAALIHLKSGARTSRSQQERVGRAGEVGMFPARNVSA